MQVSIALVFTFMPEIYSFLPSLWFCLDDQLAVVGLVCIELLSCIGRCIVRSTVIFVTGLPHYF